MCVEVEQYGAKYGAGAEVVVSCRRGWQGRRANRAEECKNDLIVGRNSI